VPVQAEGPLIILKNMHGLVVLLLQAIMYSQILAQIPLRITIVTDTMSAPVRPCVRTCPSVHPGALLGIDPPHNR
jgi:hypothetical protein